MRNRRDIENNSKHSKGVSYRELSRPNFVDLSGRRYQEDSLDDEDENKNEESAFTGDRSEELFDD